MGLPLSPKQISEVVDQSELRLLNNRINEVDTPSVLIAGCGTGQHSIGTAARYKNSRVLAIDLSLSSLAYAKRKTEELGFKNIEYMQADILDLGKLDRQFDIVESAGVLHHMDNPMSGWKVLTGCLKGGGLMKIGLYSERAREDVVAIRNEIKESGVGTSNFEMLAYRDKIMSSEEEHHKRIRTVPDFYNLSMLRDLLFHVKEHRFTLPQIKNCLNELQLKFCGFEDKDIVSRFKKFHGDGSDTCDLVLWHKFEESNPDIFIGMYQFLCQKL